MKLSIIIINYCSVDDILHSLESAFHFSSADSFEWIIVNNEPGIEAKEKILQRFPFVKWIDMNYNAGFARANNEGIKQSSGDVVLLLNPDTLVIHDAIAQCFHRFQHSDAVACSVQLLNPDLTPQISGNFFMVGGINHLLPLPYWGDFLKLIALSFKTKKPNVLRASAEERVDWINGAFLMVKKNAIELAGMLDEDFFLYAEEAEWCSRLGKVGTLCIFGDIQMIHIQGESVSRATAGLGKGYTNLFDKKGLQLMVSNHLRIRKQFGVGWFLFQLLNFTIAIPVFFIGSFIDHLIHGKNPMERWREVKGLAKNTFILWKMSPRIIQNKPHFYKVL